MLSSENNTFSNSPFIRTLQRLRHFYLYNKVLSGYHPGHVMWLNGERSNASKTIYDLVFRVLMVFSPFNHLTLLIAWENFNTLSRREGNRSYSMFTWFIVSLCMHICLFTLVLLKILLHCTML